MVKKFSLPVLLLISFLTAAGCKFFAASTFPAYLTQVSAFVDLSKEMDGFIGSAGENFDCRLYVLKNSFDQEYIFVGIHVFSPDKKKAIILDNSLNVRRELEDPQLDELHMVDVNGDFLIGNVLFSQFDLTILPSPGVDPGRQGFSAGADNFIMWIDSMTTPDALQYQQYDAAWGVVGAIQGSWIGSATFRLENVSFNQPNYSVALVLREDSSDTGRVILIPAGDFNGGALMTPLIDMYPGFEVENAEPEGFGLTRDGIVVNTHDGVAKLYGFDGKVKAEFPIGDDSDAVEAYDEAGDYYYHLDIRGRRLYKCGTWW